MPSRAVATVRSCPDEVYKTPTPVAGTWSYTLSSEYVLCSRHRFINQILVRSTTPTTTFEVYLTDANAVTVRTFTGVTGVVNDITPTRITNDWTISIAAASVNEPFDVLVKLSDEG
jgi:hypothetical protein